MGAYSVIPAFLSIPQGRVFVLHHHPDSIVKGGVLLIPPFAEEMNRSRRMLTLVAEELASCGYHVVLPDLYGTGDSEGDFSQASWQVWLEQLSLCALHVQANYGVECDAVLGVRAGALLASQFVGSHDGAVKKLLLWQPVIDGSAYLTQFLRLRLAADMLQGGEEKETTGRLIKALVDGERVEVAGYSLSSSVSDGLSAASLRELSVEPCLNICWIDVPTKEGMPVPLPNQKIIDSWQGSGVNVLYQRCVGDSFWNSLEMVDIPELLEMSVSFISSSLESA